MNNDPEIKFIEEFFKEEDRHVSLEVSSNDRIQGNSCFSFYIEQPKTKSDSLSGILLTPKQAKNLADFLYDGLETMDEW